MWNCIDGFAWEDTQAICSGSWSYSFWNSGSWPSQPCMDSFWVLKLCDVVLKYVHNLLVDQEIKRCTGTFLSLAPDSSSSWTHRFSPQRLLRSQRLCRRIRALLSASSQISQGLCTSADASKTFHPTGQIMAIILGFTSSTPRVSAFKTLADTSLVRVVY